MSKDLHSCAWAPNHITGFFYPKVDKDPILSSSLGAGINLMKGTTTKVFSQPSVPEYKIKINGKEDNARISRWIIGKLVNEHAYNQHSFDVEHSIELPISAGFGTSGSSALSLALALKDFLETDISDEECYKIAHIADVENKGGLGTVMAEIAGGLEIRVKYGGPGIGKVKSVPIDDEYEVVILYFGPFDTKKALSDKNLLGTILRYGKTCTETLLQDPSIDKYLELSQWFVKKIEVTPRHIHEIIEKMDKKGFICSMPMFGKSVYSVQSTKNARSLAELLQDYGDVIISKISNKGPHVC